ncbi:MAG: pectinacetylesterase family protein [Myxococcales bacterium]|nr:pectinacetylesterase family protein [Myxococcales bacterium]
MLRSTSLLTFLVASLSGCGTDGGDATPAQACEQAVPEATRVCTTEVSTAIRSCYTETNAPCAADDAATASALSALEQTVQASCTDEDTGALTVNALLGRLQTSCKSESVSLASRTFGGPQGAVWAGSPSGRSCLEQAHTRATALVDASLLGRRECLAAETCNAVALADEEEAMTTAAVADVEGACPGLSDLIALDPSKYVAHAVHQIDCITATTYADTAPLDVSCGPTNADPNLPRGEYAQVILDEETYGTRCGDGSPFAFQIRLAPEGEPLDRILIAMEGGGVCVFENDCANRPADLFEALSDGAPESGIMSNDPAVSPFANWTKVFLPYCNQDVFIGGGATSEFDSITVHRFGAINVRAAVRYTRDVLWALLDEEGGDGYRPDQIVAMFGGFSAGAFGTIYNYHWMIDDLQWPRTTGFPDAGLALDSGGPVSVRTLGNLLIAGGPPLGWASLEYLPPYCFAGDCAVGPELLEATAPRLKAVPEQQLLILSNQNDSTQVGTTFFESTPAWINAMRQSYCDTRDLSGVNYYLTTVSESVHVISPNPALYSGSVAGTVMSDWLAAAISDPDEVQSKVEEGSLVADIEGVEAFPCEL